MWFGIYRCRPWKAKESPLSLWEKGACEASENLGLQVHMNKPKTPKVINPISIPISISIPTTPNQSLDQSFSAGLCRNPPDRQVISNGARYSTTDP
jgi:hypothetical protein